MKKRRMHKIVAFLLTATVLFAPPCSVFATAILPSNLAETANEFLVEVLNGKPYSSYQYLTNVCGESAYVLFQSSEGGYAIVDIQNNEVVEGASYLHPYFINRNTEYCYNGPLNYYRVSGEKLVDLVTQEIYDKSSVPLIQADKSTKSCLIIRKICGQKEIILAN